MASAGQHFNQTLVAEAPPDSVSQTILASVSDVSGYTVNAASAGTIVLTRRYLPNWAIGVAIIGALFFLIGLLALLYRDTETLTISLAAEGTGTRLTISGMATPEMIARLSTTLQAKEGPEMAAGSSKLSKLSVDFPRFGRVRVA